MMPPTERQARIIWLAATGAAIAVMVGLVAGLVWGLGRILQIVAPVLWPVAVAAVLACLLDPVVDALEKRGLARTRSIVCVFALALALVIALFGSVVPQLITESRQFARGVPAIAARLQQKVEHWASHPPPLVQKILQPRASESTLPGAIPGQGEIVVTNSSGLLSTNAPAAASGPQKDGLQTATDWLAGELPGVGKWLFGQVGRVVAWFGVLAGLALVPVYTFYFLLEKRGIASSWTDYLPVTDSTFKQELVFVLNSINSYLIAFFRGQLLVAICDGVLYGLGFLVIGLPYALLIGVMAIALTMIPFLGAIVTCVTALAVALVTFGDWLHPLLVLAVFAVVQTLEGVVISPKIMGDKVGLHPVTIIIAVMAGTTLLGGLLGGILAIPFTAALRVIMFRYVWRRPSTPSSSP